jgi:Arc/MetJ-type ribon-helix-helix transcriptional regulator
MTPKKTKESKPKISVSLDQDLIDWIDEEIKTKRFASRSHAIQRALTLLKGRKE